MKKRDQNYLIIFLAGLAILLILFFTPLGEKFRRKIPQPSPIAEIRTQRPAKEVRDELVKQMPIWTNNYQLDYDSKEGLIFATIVAKNLEEFREVRGKVVEFLKARGTDDLCALDVRFLWASTENKKLARTEHYIPGCPLP